MLHHHDRKRIEPGTEVLALKELNHQQRMVVAPNPAGEAEPAILIQHEIEVLGSSFQLRVGYGVSNLR